MNTVRLAVPVICRLVIRTLLAALALGACAQAAEPALQPNTMQARVGACLACHGKQGRPGPDGYYPRLAGKPETYLYHQLLNFRDGARTYHPMANLLVGLPDAYLKEIASYFASQHVPYLAAPPANLDAGTLARGRALVQSGDPGRGVPACMACHGGRLSGVAPAIPGLLGLPRDYIVSQFGSWRSGLRHAIAPDCMGEVANKLSADDIAAVAGWLSAQPVPDPYVPESRAPVERPLQCGSQPESAQNSDGAPAPAPTVITQNAPAMGAAIPSASGPAAALAAADAGSASADKLELGRYLAVAGNCIACHTVQGKQAYAGGTSIPTPFGVFYGPNITPSAAHGIGKWSRQDFWNALHNGTRPDGQPLYPAFPYTEYTHVTREDADALYAYLMSLPPSETPSRPHELDFPYGQRFLLKAWRALYFTAGGDGGKSDPAAGAPHDAAWVRGRYLVQGLGHCAACHTPRNRWGASESSKPLQGGPVGSLGWFATPLTGDPANGLGKWTQDDIVALLHDGVSRRGFATGPMAEVVTGSTQHLSRPDLQAVAVYLKSLPATAAAADDRADAPSTATMAQGKKRYEQHCAQCHQASGEGSFPAWPALAGNVSVTAASAENAIRMVLAGGFAPATQDNPRPHSMPPFDQIMSVDDIAAVVTYIRNSWGNHAGDVRSFDVSRLR